MSTTEIFPKGFAKEVLRGLALTETMNKAFGEDFARLCGNGTTTPHVIIIASECEMLVSLTETYNEEAMDRWLKARLEKQEIDEMLS